jgi:hypothetical protein
VSNFVNFYQFSSISSPPKLRTEHAEIQLFPPKNTCHYQYCQKVLRETVKKYLVFSRNCNFFVKFEHFFTPVNMKIGQFPPPRKCQFPPPGNINFYQFFHEFHKNHSRVRVSKWIMSKKNTENMKKTANFASREKRELWDRAMPKKCKKKRPWTSLPLVHSDNLSNLRVFGPSGFFHFFHPV